MLLEEEGLTMEEIKYVVPHQANFRIIDYAARKLSADINKFYVNLDKYGNTSGASIPMALDEINRKGLLSKGDNLIIVGFGGGLTFGSALIKWQK
jgi:3-oxoacyl-[acyl-carrier-protein] synthase-3